MLLISNVKLSPDCDFCDLKKTLSNIIGLEKSEITSAHLHKRAIDARKKSAVHFICSIAFSLKGDEDEFLEKTRVKGITRLKLKKYEFPEKIASSERPIIIGFGPAGIFAALTLARAGLKPIVFEQGYDVDKRSLDIENFNSSGTLNPLSNIQFGEGGAGTFSDGKLTTGIKDVRCRAVLEEFVSHGAMEKILYEGKPHIGTDVLKNVIKSLRREIISLGGEIHFGEKVINFSTHMGALEKIKTQSANGIKEYDCRYCILAIGHSSRDTYHTLYDLGINMERKPFAVGARIEHSQALINKAQLGSFSEHPALTPADYKLSHHYENRCVYTFCMCPGGEVVNASSEEGGITTNGMSNSQRDSDFANSALLVSVSPDDFEGEDVLAGIEFQRKIERRAFELSRSYKPIAQRVGDFLAKKRSFEGVSHIKGGVTFGSISDVLPSFISEGLEIGIKEFDKKLRGFGDKNALLLAPETRSSAPLRILRDEAFNSSISGLIPCGEGAGYAGGIMSASVDGIKCAEAIIERILKDD